MLTDMAKFTINPIALVYSGDSCHSCCIKSHFTIQLLTTKLGDIYDVMSDRELIMSACRHFSYIKEPPQCNSISFVCYTAISYLSLTISGNLFFLCFVLS